MKRNPAKISILFISICINLVLVFFSFKMGNAAVTLTYFDAEPDMNGIVIKWGTASEYDILGFYVLRSESENGTYTRLNNEVIIGQGNSITGADYAFDDSNVLPGVTYYYELEVLDLDNQSEFIGPIFTTFGVGTFTPTVTRTRNPSATATTTRTSTLTKTASKSMTVTSTVTASRTRTVTSTNTSISPNNTGTMTKTSTRTPTKTQTLSGIIYRSATATRTITPSPSASSTITHTELPSVNPGTSTITPTKTEIPPLLIAVTPEKTNQVFQSVSLAKIALVLSGILFGIALLFFLLGRMKKKSKS